MYSYQEKLKIFRQSSITLIILFLIGRAFAGGFAQAGSMALPQAVATFAGPPSPLEAVGAIHELPYYVRAVREPPLQSGTLLTGQEPHPRQTEPPPERPDGRAGVGQADKQNKSPHQYTPPHQCIGVGTGIGVRDKIEEVIVTSSRIKNHEEWFFTH